VGAINIMAEMPMGQTAERVADILGAKGNLSKRAASGVASTVSSVVPNLVASVARADDPMREKNTETMMGTVRDAILDRLPVANRSMPTRLHKTLGTEIERERSTAGRVLSLVDPWGSSPDRTQDNPILAEFSRTGFAPSPLSKMQGETQADYRERVAEYGANVREALMAILEGGPGARATLAKHGVSPALASEYKRLSGMGSPEALRAQADIQAEVIRRVRTKTTTRKKARTGR
jgi:hypothetical protein